MRTDIRAEIVKQSSRPANWLLLGVGILLMLIFDYIIPYAGYSGAASGAPTADRGLASMLPAQFVGGVLGGLPVFVGALALIFGALVAGSEYHFETWKTVLVQRPSRWIVYAAKITTIAIGTLLGVLALLALAACASVLVATVENQPIAWPSALDILAGIGGGWLIAMLWSAFGVLLAVAFRSLALSIGLGLVWLLVVQNLLSGVAAPLLDWIDSLQKVLPGPNAGALAAGLGASTDTPGVSAIVGSGHASIAVAAYLLAFCGLGSWLLARRDIG